MKIANLTDENFLEFTVNSYINMRCTCKDEFLDDLTRVKYLKRLFRKFLIEDNIDFPRVRLALNHVIIFFNVFEVYSGNRILYFRMEQELYSILKTFLFHLNYQSSIIHGINGKDIEAYKIPINDKILEKLQSI